MLASYHSAVVLRGWPFFASALASAAGALFCGGQWALASSLIGAEAIIADPAALTHWRHLATLYLAGFGVCLLLFVGSCIALRRRRGAAPPGAGGFPI